MSSVLGVVDYVVIGLMLAVSASIGLFFRFTGGRQKTTHEFLMAGRTMGIGPVAFSLMATCMSAIAILGLPAETYVYGSQYGMWIVGVPIGGLIAAYALLPVFFDIEVLTAYEYLEKRFGRTTRTVASLFFTLQMVFYMASVLYAPSLALNAVTGLSTWTSVISLAVVCTFYCSLGGLKAVLWTDVFQSFLMYFTTIAITVKGSMDAGGVGNVIDRANEGGRLVFFNTSSDLTQRYTLWNSVISGIIFGMHLYGTNQTQVQRMLSTGNLKKAQWAVIISFPLIAVFRTLCIWDGVVVYSNFHDCDPMQHPGVKLKSADQLIPYSILKMFGDMPGLPGLCIAGIFSASLSTVSSAVNSLTAVTMEDFIRPFCSCKRLTETWAAFLAKIIAIAYGGVCLLLTVIIGNFRGILEATNILFGMIGGPMLGIYYLGMFTTTANEPGILIGLLVGFVINMWMGFGSYASKLRIPRLPRSTEGCLSLTNDTMYFSTNPNETSLFDPALENVTDVLSITNEEEKYVLPIYKVSFLWFPVVSCFVVFVVGYFVSLIIGIWRKYPVRDPRNYSPFVRRWYFSASKMSSQDTIHHDVELKLKISNSVSSPNAAFTLPPAPKF